MALIIWQFGCLPPSSDYLNRLDGITQCLPREQSKVSTNQLWYLAYETYTMRPRR